MKWPWKEREKEAEKAAEEAREKLEEVKARRSEVEAVVQKIRHHRTLNGWSEEISRLWGEH